MTSQELDRLVGSRRAGERCSSERRADVNSWPWWPGRHFKSTTYQKSDYVNRSVFISVFLPNFTKIRFETTEPCIFKEVDHPNRNNKMNTDMGSVPDPKDACCTTFSLQHILYSSYQCQSSWSADIA